MTRLVLVFKAFFQLGWRKSLLFGFYQLLLKVGIYKLLTPINQKSKLIDTPLHIPFDLPDKEEMLELLEREGLENITDWANELVNGEIHPFGWEKHPLDLNPGTSLKHWTQHKGSQHNGQDIKFTWEPARFGWATMLSRAYFLTGDEKYTDAFWRYFEDFQVSNPINQGPNWASAQEVGLRLMHWVFCYAVFQHSPNTSEARKQSLAHAIAEHAQRIPPTLLYARAQNNNHLLSEAAALYTASLVLPQHLHAKKWRTLGWRWFNWGIQNQIAENGAYMQHSTTYHRLMLTLGLWMNLLVETQPEAFPPATQTKLAAATDWITHISYFIRGNVPNLGPNDGALIFQYAPALAAEIATGSVIQAARAAFTKAGQNPLFEFGRWFVHQPKYTENADSIKGKQNVKTVIYNPKISSAVYLRTPTFTDRPGHADLLHVDLWRNGRHVTLDPGTYLYNADPPWDNALQGTDVHNTVMVNGEHQMTKAGRFLWLDWPTTEILSVGPEDIPASITAQHNGYKKFGITHRRTVTAEDHQWVVKDTLFAKKESQQASARLHWLLPDSEYTLNGTTLTLTTYKGNWRLNTPEYPINIDIEISAPATLTLARAGELLYGEGTVEPHRGWYSSTYAHKTPALSLAYETHGALLPITLTTTFTFPH